MDQPDTSPDTVSERRYVSASLKQLAASLVAGGYSLGLAAEQLNLSKRQVRTACALHGVKPSVRATKHRKQVEAPPTAPEVLAALEDVKAGMSLSKAALKHGMTLSRLAGQARRIRLRAERTKV